jgi:hypothetical protein
MANFTTETKVRDAFQLSNTTRVPSSLVVQSIDDSHIEILRVLDPSVDTGTPEAGLVTAETILAGAHVLRSLSWGHAAEQQHLALGSSRIEEGNRFRELHQAADIAESQAWYMLEPYTKEVAASSMSAATDTVPIVEEG